MAGGRARHAEDARRTRADPEPRWWVQDIVVALLVGGVLVAGQWWLDERRVHVDRSIETQRAANAQELEDQRTAAGEQLENLRFVRERSSNAVEGRPFSTMDLARTSLSGLQLATANFNQANLIDADLVDTNLQRAQLRLANLSGANLLLANLSGADLAGADLSDADMSEARLSWARMPGANLERTDFSNADLSGAVLFAADLTGANLTGADLSRANLAFAELAQICHSSGTIWPQGFVAPQLNSEACLPPANQVDTDARRRLIGTWISSDPSDATFVYRFLPDGQYEWVGWIWQDRGNSVFQLGVRATGEFEIDDAQLTLNPQVVRRTRLDPRDRQGNYVEESFHMDPAAAVWAIDDGGTLRITSNSGVARYSRQLE